jgi:hypothetical protein
LPLEEKIGERRDTEFTEVRRKKEKGKRKKQIPRYARDDKFFGA